MNSKKTPLYSLHTELGARLTEFAGYEMPIQYPGGIKEEHAQVRNRAGLFDISHMGQIKITGEKGAALIETLVTGDVSGLKINHQLYTVFTNTGGGIIDDLMITKLDSCLLLVVNAACRDRDLEYLITTIGHDCQVEEWLDRSLLALQGPQAASVLRNHVPDIQRLGFMQAGQFKIDSIHCLVHRCGYTGEDGFEISVAAEDVEHLARLLLQHEMVGPVGLGARDSLRLEAGLCLYGQDLDETISPVEAGLGWTVAHKYTGNSPVPAGFPGADEILVQLQNGTGRTRTGIRPEGKIPVRKDTKLLNINGKEIGKISSGGFGPTLNGPLAMGYVESAYTAPGTELMVEIRDRVHKVLTASLPFVAHRYYKP